MKAPHPHDTEDHNRLVLAVVLSLLIVTGYHFFFAERPATPPQQTPAAQQAAIAEGTSELKPRNEVISSTTRLPIRGKLVQGTLSLKGARLDDLELVGQYKTVDSQDLVPLLNPSGAEGAFYTESGWLAADGTALALPTQDTVWRLKEGSPKAIESGGKPVVLQWDNGQGLTFERSIAVDDHYLFTVVQSVSNHTGNSLSLNAYHLTARAGLPPDFSGFYVLHEGPLGWLGKTFEDPAYKSLIKGKKIEVQNTQGWLGITDKYWMVTILPEPKQTFNARIVGSMDGATQRFQSDLVESPVTVGAGTTVTDTVHVYAGVKVLKTMKAYESQYGFDRLDLGFDFGIWYLITKPFYYVFHLIAAFFAKIGFGVYSIGAAILTMTIVVRGAMFPLATKSYTSMARMKQIAPQLKELQEKHKDDKAKLQMEVFELYKREDANPFSGCWPMLIQVPIFFALYKVILLSVDLRHAPFWGWVHDLSAPDPTSAFNLFGLLPWTPPPLFMIGAWPLLFCVTMVLQKRLSPPMPDPVQERMQAYFPYFITIMMAHFAVGLVIYWTWSNVLAVLQQYYILKKVGGENVSLLRGHHERRKKKPKHKH